MLFIFGIAGMALAALGTYGLVSYTVKQSTREIGIRIALGAPLRSIVSRFLTRGLRLGAIGAGIGVMAALVLTRFLQSALFGVSATDAASFAGALAIVLSGVVLATLDSGLARGADRSPDRLAASLRVPACANAVSRCR